jgi:hypothetical protein
MFFAGGKRSFAEMSPNDEVAKPSVVDPRYERRLRRIADLPALDSDGAVRPQSASRFVRE